MSLGLIFTALSTASYSPFLSVDIDAVSSGETKDGFTPFYVRETRPSDPPPTMVDDATGVKLVMSGCSSVRRYAFVGGRGTTTTDKLLGDECFRNTPGDVVLTLTNVPKGDYRLITYHNDAAAHCGGCLPIEVHGVATQTKYVRTGNHFEVEDAMQAQFETSVGADETLRIKITHVDTMGTSSPYCTVSCEDSQDSGVGEKCSRCGVATSAAQASRTGINMVHTSFNGFVLESAATTTSTATTSTTTTVTTHTRMEALEGTLTVMEAKMEQQIKALSDTIEAQTARIAELEAAKKGSDGEIAALKAAAAPVAAVAEGQELVLNQIVSAIRRVVEAVPAPRSNGDNGGNSPPTVEADGAGNLVLNAPDGTVQLKSASCGADAAVDLCAAADVVAIADALRLLDLE